MVRSGRWMNAAGADTAAVGTRTKSGQLSRACRPRGMVGALALALLPAVAAAREWKPARRVEIIALSGAGGPRARAAPR